MEQYSTRYGILKSVGDYSLYPDGTMKECMLLEKVSLHTSYGELIPQYEFNEDRRKYIYSLSFFEDGTLRRITLNDKANIATPLGRMDAELITFYQNGNIKRLFPLNGRISAYWEENEESRLATEDEIKLSCGTLKAKVIAYSFYKSGVLKDLTLWPKQVIQINTPVGEVRVRIGIAFYEDGSIKSIEPSFPIAVNTPIGRIKAYDVNANGISGDKNSLSFTGEGVVRELITSGMKVTILDEQENALKVYSPIQNLDEDGLEVSFISLKISFDQDSIRFNDEEEYRIADHKFIIESYYKSAPGMCSDCSTCGLCSN